jgi:hypothetical protein
VFAVGGHTVQVTVTDIHGNSASSSFTVTVADNSKPLVFCKNIVISLDESGQCNITAASVDGGCSDNCTASGKLIASLDKASFDCSNLGSNTVVLTATDASGNSNSGNAIVTVQDTTPPNITCPANLTVTNGLAPLAPVTYATPTTSDNCTVTNVTCAPASGSNFPMGTTTVTCTATDSSGNSSVCYFTVTRSSACSYTFNGFQEPIGGADATGGTFANSIRTFKLGSTIPVKFKLTCFGTPVTTGIHTLQAAKCSGLLDNTDQVMTLSATDAATTGNQFRLTDTSGAWHFNLDTKASGLSQGTWLLIATLADGTQHFAYVGIKK